MESSYMFLRTIGICAHHNVLALKTVVHIVSVLTINAKCGLKAHASLEILSQSHNPCLFACARYVLSCKRTSCTWRCDSLVMLCPGVSPHIVDIGQRSGTKSLQALL